jgi:hypothetical protein
VLEVLREVSRRLRREIVGPYVSGQTVEEEDLPTVRRPAAQPKADRSAAVTTDIAA